MNYSTRFSGLVAALLLALPASGFSHDHPGWHGHYGYYGPHFRYGGYFPFFAGAPYFAYYGGAPYYDGYYDSPPVGVSVSSAPYGGVYHGARVDDHGDDLAIDVQRALRHDGYYHGAIDGDVGSGTRAAIRQYQYDHQLEVTGRMDRALLHSLGMD